MSDSYQHSHDHEPATSTGFLPISLALALFITGLFVLDLIPGLSCGSEATPAAATDDRR